MRLSSLLLTLQRRMVLFVAVTLFIVGGATAAVWLTRPTIGYVATVRVPFKTAVAPRPPSGGVQTEALDAELPVTDRVQRLYAAALRERVDAQWDPSTQIVTLSARADTAEKAREIVSGLPRAYQAQVRRQVDEAQARAERRAADNDIELTVARQSLQRMGQGQEFPTDLRALDEQVYRLTVTLHRLTERDQELARQIGYLYERLSHGDRSGQGMPTFLRPEIAPSPLVQEMESQLARLEAQYAGLDAEVPEARQTLGRMADLRARIASERLHHEANQIAEIRSRDRARIAEAERERGLLAEQRAETEKRLQALVQDKGEYLRRQEKAAALEARRIELARGVDACRAAAAQTPASMELDGLTLTPVESRRPFRRSLIPISIGVGLLLGLVAAVLAERFSHLLRTPSDVRRYVHLPLVGSVPVVKGETCTVVKLAPRDALTEMWNRIGTVVGALAERHKARAVLVTSVVEQEGKSTCAANLAVTFARMGHRTILVDADLRRPTLHGLFGVENRVGLSSFLTGKLAARMLLEDIKRRIDSEDAALPDTAPPGVLEFREPSPDGAETAGGETTDLQAGALRVMSGTKPEAAAGASNVAAHAEQIPGLEQILLKTELENLWVVPSGPSPTNPAALIRNPTLRGLVEYVKAHAEFVIFDTPPLASAADALALVGQIPTYLLVIGADTVTHQQVRWAKTLLDNVGAHALGAILNCTTLPDKSYAYYRDGNRRYREDDGTTTIRTTATEVENLIANIIPAMVSGVKADIAKELGDKLEGVCKASRETGEYIIQEVARRLAVQQTWHGSLAPSPQEASPPPKIPLYKEGKLNIAGVIDALKQQKSS